MIRLLLGLIKGASIGALVGYGAYSVGMSGGFHWLTYGLVGVIVGLLVGRPVWSHLRDPKSTFVVPILKSVFGYGLCVGIYALVAKVWGAFDLSLMDETHNLTDWQFIFGAVVGGLYGAFVELDDAAPSK